MFGPSGSDNKVGDENEDDEPGQDGAHHDGNGVAAVIYCSICMTGWRVQDSPDGGGLLVVAADCCSPATASTFFSLASLSRAAATSCLHIQYLETELLH